MNAIRSSEKSLLQLVMKARTSLKEKAPSKIGPVKSIDYLLGKRSYHKHAILGKAPKMKLRQKAIGANPRFISNVAPSQIDKQPFMSPDRLDPKIARDIPIEPIAPLTHPKFTKTKSGEGSPSVTRVLSATMPAASQFILDRWRESMIKKLGPAGFAKYQADTFERGRLLHALLANYLLGQGEPVEGQNLLSTQIVSNLWKSIRNIVQERITNVRLVEHIVTHPTMKYRGIVDCVACFDNQLVVIDFKTAEKPKNNIESLYDNPIQVSAYCGAINNDLTISKHVIDRNITTGVVIVAYIDGSEATAYHLNDEQITKTYWQQWVTRLNQYCRMEESKSDKKRLLAVKDKPEAA